MHEERDPDLQWMRDAWRSMETPESAQAAAMRAWRARFGVVRSRHFWTPVAAAALAASLALLLIRGHPDIPRYQPVAQPRIIDISQGEQP